MCDRSPLGAQSDRLERCLARAQARRLDSRRPPLTLSVTLQAEAAMKPAGDGRSAPNSHPRLAHPMGQKPLSAEFCRCM